ncbi:metalloregulator ArsR/SmtB family transcription factor [Embleya sp. NBC_00896]|uniref:ArsR/SmtB family transcription factor n=1 Tax=Embleya sp. NBC_00896 TaxID=2975961 RepID=UPI002F908BEB|nr:metalloregulator ArsR/SmtB family transcription factor [Embleya sp. NBC_00896]
MQKLVPFDVTATDEARCCPPVAREALGVSDAERLAGMFKALGDPIRLRLYSMIAARGGEEVCVCDIQDVGVSQPTVSHHLKKLREAGLITGERRGTWVYYRAVPSASASLSALLDVDA